MILHADTALARRLELADAGNGLECVEALQRLRPALLPTAQAIGSGWALFAGPVSPLTHALGLGWDGAVQADDLVRVEDFYRERDTPVSIDLCPLAHESLRDFLCARRYRITEFNHTLVRPVHGAEVLPFPTLRVRIATEGEDTLWGEALARGFFGRDTITAEEVEIGLAIFHMANSRCYIAEVGGEVAGAGALSIREGLATLFADAALPRFRQRGVHQSLIAARLAAAQAAGCALATAGVMPGSGSQRNFERCGFRIAYTKMVMTQAFPS